MEGSGWAQGGRRRGRGRGKVLYVGSRKRLVGDGMAGGNEKRAKKPLLLHPPINTERVSLLSQSHPLAS